ncbi:MAG: hypothetical protein IJ575_03340 [Selenomonadaceae bacterium]|nr:hypothetical protein [Selenomonadaceae bacterium]
MFHVCYALYDASGKYTKFLGTSIQSLFENTKEPVTIHLLHDSTLTDTNRKKLRHIVYSFDQKILFYDVDLLAPGRGEEIVNKIPKVQKKLSVATFYRALILDLLPKSIEKVIYLDADIIVNLDIKDFWNVDLKKFPVAAVPQITSGYTQESLSHVNPLVKNEIIKWNDYFNAGVLLLDLTQLRKLMNGSNLLSRCIDILVQYPESPNLDQDALNILFRDNYLKLPVKFNRLVHVARKFGNPKKAGREITHFSDRSHGINFKDDFNRLWFSYFLRTPFYSNDVIMELFDTSQDLNRHVAHLWKKIANLSLTRRRGFFIYPKDMERVVNFIGKNDGDIGLNAAFPDAIDNLVNEMKSQRGNMIFFINVDSNEFSNIRDSLVKHGFKENEDFFNVKELSLMYDFKKLVLEI